MHHWQLNQPLLVLKPPTPNVKMTIVLHTDIANISETELWEYLASAGFPVCSYHKRVNNHTTAECRHGQPRTFRRPGNSNNHNSKSNAASAAKPEGRALATTSSNAETEHLKDGISMAKYLGFESNL